MASKRKTDKPAAPVTAGDEHKASETREPTAIEIAETSKLQDDKTRHVDTLQARAAEQALLAFNNAESHIYNATVTLSLVICAESMRSILTDQSYEAQKADYVFRRDVLFPIAMSGGMIWRKSAEHAEAIALALAQRKPEKEIRAMAADYVRLKGGKLVEGLAKLKTASLRLSDYVATNMQPELHHAAVLANESSVEAATDYFKRAIAEKVGTSYAKLSDRLQQWKDDQKAPKADKPDAPKVEADKPDTGGNEPANDTGTPAEPVNPVTAALALIETMSADDFASFAARFDAIRAERSTPAETPADVPVEAKPEALPLAA